MGVTYTTPPVRNEAAQKEIEECYKKLNLSFEDGKEAFKVGPFFRQKVEKVIGVLSLSEETQTCQIKLNMESSMTT